VIRHAPPAYECPFCAVAGGRETARNVQADVVLRDEHTTAFISPKWWAGNEGHAIVVPNRHWENIYAISRDALAAVSWSAAVVARAMRESYACDGTSTRQHNEPGAGQDVWHFHVHVFPRFDGDDLYTADADVRWTTPEERAPYAAKLAAALADYSPGS
jgi:histidine triad (HIT) family protein